MRGTNCQAFPATPRTATLLPARSGAMVGRPWRLRPLSVLTLAKSEEGAGVDRCLTLFRAVDRLSFTRTLEQNR
jgi:hypothetical protein